MQEKFAKSIKKIEWRKDSVPQTGPTPKQLTERPKRESKNASSLFIVARQERQMQINRRLS